MTAYGLRDKYFVKSVIESNIVIDCWYLRKYHIGQYTTNTLCLTLSLHSISHISLLILVIMSFSRFLVALS